MSVTVDCGEGKHTLCVGTGEQAYLVPQEGSEPFHCACWCHHGGETPDPNPFDEHTRLWADEMSLALCRRCGHSSDVHSHDDADPHEATDPDCRFRCNDLLRNDGKHCDCPDMVRR